MTVDIAPPSRDREMLCRFKAEGTTPTVTYLNLFGGSGNQATIYLSPKATLDEIGGILATIYQIRETLEPNNRRQIEFRPSVTQYDDGPRISFLAPNIEDVDNLLRAFGDKGQIKQPDVGAIRSSLGKRHNLTVITFEVDDTKVKIVARINNRQRTKEKEQGIQINNDDGVQTVTISFNAKDEQCETSFKFADPRYKKPDFEDILRRSGIDFYNSVDGNGAKQRHGDGLDTICICDPIRLAKVLREAGVSELLIPPEAVDAFDGLTRTLTPDRGDGRKNIPVAVQELASRFPK